MEQEKKDLITLEDFKKVDLRIGTIRTAELVPNTDKLLRLLVDLGEEEPRQIIAGIAPFIPDPATLVGTQCVFVANMAPRELRGLVSSGMLLAARTKDGVFAFLRPTAELPVGTRLT
ncbi:hypothetical protein A2761_02380 [Candidatus Kaiserbacteria bacterium RIFCSPHIGHO2_01_FULL_51_33]|uniref:Methionine--tRNA ligase n=1 Tax=Candidatus Kaiserbacteria bacterium RIFCSPLOWO2_01_FULL_51_21 TaxID=1798508 RepID=A0A1F6EEJ2_9BACT|nr:MAG: hypothetical protein A2761_02380 [Candidatus Kaiserbacteria bacterium RIFCSPHIGHO2_01_FULL_51_33]OGG71632.1 MAG: hypothetical protein A3A35_00470 [Candidatus Kaiserbacteria bacterium RIFCSPLOWO2_01_FULL_51_21]